MIRPLPMLPDEFDHFEPAKAVPEKPMTLEQVAARAKRARKDLVRLVHGVSSGEEIDEAWAKLQQFDPGFSINRLPRTVRGAVKIFST